MIKVKTKTLSLLYHPGEDRMKLIVNKNEKDQIDFWITRRFYFSLLFELDTMLEELQIVPPPFRKKNSCTPLAGKNEKSSPVKNQNEKEEIEKTLENKVIKRKAILLENIDIKFSKKKKEFILLFHSGQTNAESVLKQDDFLRFYHILKGTFPKGEWGII